jgi:pimeloyl-ACP methyl ester carboxylesterase
VLACTTVLAHTDSDRPAILLIHGAANSAAVWAFWQQELAAHGWSSYALDLPGHGKSPPVDLACVSMTDYAHDVQFLLRHLQRPPIVLGWSMGGLVAMMVAAAGGVAACVTLAPSTPTQYLDPAVTIRTGVFTAEVYGITSPDPTEQPAMPDLDLAERQVALAALGPESLQARDERQCGIVIDVIPCPLLLITGTRDTLWPGARYDTLWLLADRLSIDGASHWGLVLNRRVLTSMIPRVIGWWEQALR